MSYFKQLLFILLALVSVQGWGIEVDGINYTFNAATKTATVTQGSTIPSDGKVTIPEKVKNPSNNEEYMVTSIGYCAFYNCTDLISVTIPSSVTSIGAQAFYNCTGLTSVTIPSSVTSIGTQAFWGCTGLTSVTFSEDSKLTSIESDAFFSCTGLTSVTIPSGVTSIGYYAFYYCTDLASVTFSEDSKLTSIGGGAFRSCTSLALTSLPSGVTSIREEAFSGCSALALTSLPSGLTSIENYAFYACPKLALTSLPSGVTSIGEKAFYGCTSLALTSLPSGVTSIGDNAFQNCKGLTSVTFSADSKLESIGSGAFSGCSKLTSVTVNATTPPALGTSAFPSSAILYVPLGSETAYSSANNWKDISVIAGVNEGKTELAVIADFAELMKLNTLYTENFPYKITSLKATGTLKGAEIVLIRRMAGGDQQDGGFTEAGSLTHLDISGATIAEDKQNWYYLILGEGEYGTELYYTQKDKITAYMFTGLPKLQSVILPEGVTTIEGDAFCSSDLTSITIPSSVTSIKSYAFDYCSKLTSVTVNATTAPTLGSTDVFTGAPKSAMLLYVPKDATGYTNSAWSEYFAKIQESEFTDHNINYGLLSATTVEVISGGTYTGDIIIPATVNGFDVVAIGSGAFKGCDLKSVELPASITTIGKEAFQGCTSLASVFVEAKTSITPDTDAFTGISGSAVLYVPKGAATAYSSWSTYFGGGIKEREFTDNNIIYSILSARTVEVASGGVYSGDIIIPATVNGFDVVAIGSGAFKDCDLKSVTIPASVTSIGSDAFSGCTQLATVLSEAKAAPTLGDDAFSDISGSAVLYILKGATGYTTSSWPGFSKITSEFTDNNIIYSILSATTVEVKDGKAYTGITLELETVKGFDVVAIGNTAFQSHKTLTDVSFPKVTSIGTSAFSGCTKLANVSFPEVTSIGGSAFWYCGFTDVSFPKATSVGGSAFSRCTNLFSVSLPEVTSVESNAFRECTNLFSVSLPKVTIVWTNVFENCSSLTSVIIENPTITSYDISRLMSSTDINLNPNPNCLVYLPEGATDQKAIQALSTAAAKKNFIFGGTAAEITLVDGKNFNCPIPFIAEKISYTRTPEVWAGKESNGWQTIVLPFTVTDYKTTKAGITPISKTDEEGHFWLHELITTDAERNTVYFQTTGDGIMNANEPYLISFPGNDYELATLEKEAPIIFSATNAEVPITPENLSIEEGNCSLYRVYQSQTVDGYVLENGTSFELKENATVAPFYAYISKNGESAFPHLLISTKLPTALDEQQETSATLQVLTTPEGIVILASAPGKAAIKNAMGIVVSYLTLEAGSNPVGNLPTGVYFIEGQKFFVQ